MQAISVPPSWVRITDPELCYVGVDLEIPVENPPKAPDVHLLTADYRTEMDKIQKWMEDRMLGQPRTITSLFSSELTASPEVNSRFYRSLFERFPRLERLIVSGFYYSERRRKSRVEEVSGLLSWQSIGDLETELDERRHLMRVPSKLFGPDVVEVWREFIRPS